MPILDPTANPLLYLSKITVAPGSADLISFVGSTAEPLSITITLAGLSAPLERMLAKHRAVSVVPFQFRITTPTCGESFTRLPFDSSEPSAAKGSHFTQHPVLDPKCQGV